MMVKLLWTNYRRFSSVNEAECWGRKHYSYWLKEYQNGGELSEINDFGNSERFLSRLFSQEELQKKRMDMLEYKWFSFYCGGNWGLAINEKFRFGYTEYKFSEDQLTEMQKVMDNRLNKSYVPENIWGYRFLDYNKLCKSIRKHHIYCGTVIEDKGYMGVGLVKSSLYEMLNFYDTMLAIMIPKGAKGLYIDLISNREKEQELLFARGSRLKVLFSYREKGIRVIVCKMLTSYT